MSDIVRHCSTRFRKLSDRNSKMFNNVRHKNGFRTPAVIGCHWLPKVRKLAVIGCFWQSSAAGFSCIKISVADLFSWKLSDKCSTFWQTSFLTLFPKIKALTCLFLRSDPAADKPGQRCRTSRLPRSIQTL